MECSFCVFRMDFVIVCVISIVSVGIVNFGILNCSIVFDGDEVCFVLFKDGSDFVFWG